MSEYYLIIPVEPTTSNWFPNRLRSVRVEFFSSILPIHAPPPDPMPFPLQDWSSFIVRRRKESQKCMLFSYLISSVRRVVLDCSPIARCLAPSFPILLCLISNRVMDLFFSRASPNASPPSFVSPQFSRFNRTNRCSMNRISWCR